jgi:molybdopterin/thiamine biosynthesis adenylyltransferase
MKTWDYNEAFSRNRGLISVEEQEKLRNSRVAIAGMGGVGGFHAITLARLGVGNFNISDMDEFEVGNFNRQIGAGMSTVAQKKVRVLQKMIKDINPDADVRVFSEGIKDNNVDDFLKNAHLFVDGFDFFVFDIRRLVFKKAREKGIFSITAGPIGFGTTGIIFDPNGMTFDEYFNISDKFSYEARIASFLMGIVPDALHRGYTDMAALNIKQHRGPSSKDPKRPKPQG